MSNPSTQRPPRSRSPFPGARSLALRFALSSAVPAATLGLAGCGAEPTRPPNVLLVVVDTLRADRLGCYGADRETTPSLDELAASSVRFERAYAPAPWTRPSVASILTGLEPASHGAIRVNTPLAKEHVTLAELLGAEGYATGGVISNIAIGRGKGFAQGFDHYLESDARGHTYVSTEGVTDKSLEMMERFAQEEAPFFLFVHYFDPHYNYVQHEGVDFAPERAGRLDGRQEIGPLRKLDLTEPEVDFLRDLYDEEIHHTDAGIGRLLENLERLGLEEDTVVIVTADHGEEFLEHGWLGHTTHLYEEVQRVPLLIHVPGRGPRTVTTPVSLVSVAPTVLELLGLSPNALRADGPSLTAHLEGREPDEVDFLLMEVDFQPVSIPEKLTKKVALVGERYKLIRDGLSGKVELYDLEADPRERQDLSASRADLVTRLETLLDERLSRRQEAATTPDAPVDEAELEMLDSLGYGGD